MNMINYASWLRDVNDDALISTISIPGTHNSAASHTALPSVQCQDADIKKQLEHGIRFLDIRTSKNVMKSGDDQNDLIAVHGKFPVKLIGNVYLKDILKDVYNFLENHNSETVIVSIKQEGNGDWDNENDEFPNLIWDRYVNPNKDKWYLNTDIPRLGNVRGKAIMFRRFGVKNKERSCELGIDAAWWQYNCIHDDRSSLQIQDWCELSSADDISKKAQYIKDLSQKANQYNSSNPSDPKLFINFCSGSNFFDPSCWPSKIAEELRKDRIEESFFKGSGIIILDYSESNDWKLAKSLIDKNF